MNKLIALAVVIGLATIFMAARYELAPKRATAPYHADFGATTMTNAATVYHTLENPQGDDLWFADDASISVQVFFDETGGSSTTVVTLQGSNQINAASPRWVDIAASSGFTADKDTTFVVTAPTYALYRLKFVQSGTATADVYSDWIVE